MQRLLHCLAVILAFSVCFSGCTPRVVQSTLKPAGNAAKPLSANAEYLLFGLTEIPPENAQRLGSLKITDSGFTVGCSFENVVELARENTYRAGGNAFKITSHQTPDVWSTCHRITGEMLLLTPEQIAAYKLRNSPDIQKIKIRQKLLYDSLLALAGGDSLKVLSQRMPEFPGGEQAMMKFLSQAVKYPATAMKDKVTGINVASFVIDGNGEITDINMIKSIREDLDQETMRIIRSMPVWIPGFQNGKAVKVRYNLPITYSIGRKKR